MPPLIVFVCLALGSENYKLAQVLLDKDLIMKDSLKSQGLKTGSDGKSRIQSVVESGGHEELDKLSREVG